MRASVFSVYDAGLSELDRDRIDKYIRALESLPRVDYAPEDAAYIDAYLNKLQEIGISVDEEEDDMLYRLYGIQAKKDTSFIKDLRDAIIQYHEQSES